MAETIIRLFKTEVIHAHGPWRSRKLPEMHSLMCGKWDKSLESVPAPRPP